MEEGRVQAIKDQYFREYQQQLMEDFDRCQQELLRWEAADATILSQDLNEQATYADYVICKICTEQPEEIIIETSSTMFDDLTPNYKLNSSAIGNVALLIKTTLDFDGYDELKQRLQEQYDAMIEAQKAIRQSDSWNNSSNECTLQ